MPLQPQVIDIDMGLGLDTFTDPKRVVPGKFTTLENARFVRGKRLEMRRGNVAYGGTYKIGNTGSASDSYGSFSNRLSVKRTKTLRDVPVFFGEYQDAAASSQAGGARFVSSYRDLSVAQVRLKYGYADSPGNSPAILVNTCRAVNQKRSKNDLLCADSCLVGSTIVSVWAEGTSSSWDFFFDTRSTDGALIRSGSTSLTGGSGGIVAGGGWCMAIAVTSTRAWLVVALSATSIKICIVDISTTGALTFTSNTYTVTSIKVDAVVLGSDVFFMGHDLDGGTGVVIKSMATSTTTPGAFTAKNSYTLGGATLRCLAFAKPKTAATKLRAFWRESILGMRGASITASTGATVTGPTTLAGGTGTGAQLSAVEIGDNALWAAFSDTSAAAVDNYSTTIAAWVEKGSFVSLSSITASLPGVVATRILDRTATDTASLWVRWYNTAKTESCYFQYQLQTHSSVSGAFDRGTAYLSAKQLSGRAVPYNIATHGVSNLFSLDSSNDRTLLLDSFLLQVDSAASTRLQNGLTTMTSNYDNRAALSSSETNNVLVLGGGFLGMWDGQHLVSSGFLGRPSIVTASAAAGTGAMSNGTYSIVAVLEWYDGAGNRHQSAPSDPVTVVASAGTANQQIAATINNTGGTGNFPFVGRYDTSGVGYDNYAIVYYSTTNGGTVYRRSTDSTTGSGARKCSDADLLTREVLYTTGGTLSNSTPDGPPVVGNFNNRLLLSSASDDSILYAQKPPYPGYGPEFSDQLTLSIAEAGGPVTAIVENVDKCCVFKKRSIQVFTGEGYTATGAGGYSNAETIYEHLGCPGPWAATATPVGVMFATGGQGIWLLGRDLQLSYVGEGVDSWKDTEVYSVSVVPNEQEVRWLMASGEILAYNWTAAAWSVFAPFPCWDIGLANGVPIYLRQSTSNLGGVYTDSDTAFTDMMSGVIDVSAANITMQAVTGWMNFAGLQGYQRVWRALFTGDYSDIHTLLVDVGYDYKPTYADAFSLASANIMAGSSVYDGQVTLHQSFSKAVRLKLRASSSAGDTTGPMSLTGLSFEVGILPRGARMPSTKGA